MARTRAVKWCSVKVNVPGIAWAAYESETAFQIYCADWLRKQYELTGAAGFTFWHHSANERYGARAGMLARMMGQSKGFPDLIHCGMRVAIELKIPGGRKSIEQNAWLKHLSGENWTTEVCYSFEEFRDIVLSEVRLYGGG